MLLFQLFKILLTDPVQFIVALIILIVPLLISITVHEWAHGFTAYKFGDPTPARQGRLSFNPFAHLDPIGTLMLFIIGIGWAKPVEINPNNINKKYKLMLVALAGPLSNFILAIFFTFILYFLIKISITGPFLENNGLFYLTIILLKLIIKINFILGIFNLLPIPPLDGANVISNLMPDKMAENYFKIAPYSLPILFLLIISGGIKFIFIFTEILLNTLIIFIDYFLGNLF
ncbi:MAG: site-2 protease family protein [Candidatus Omnitrophica bacterium]|nr:site-2 protease family protein [Candidatus Omnitrophota bacterium]